jgi:thiaminase/transcriptional activator TenA
MTSEHLSPPEAARHSPSGSMTLLSTLIEESADQLIGHPYYRALCDGSLSEVAFDHFAAQDACYLLPAYGLALARCSTLVASLRHATFLSRMALQCLENAAADRLSPRLEAHGVPEASPTTVAYANFLTAATVRSASAGLGAVLPTAWLQLLVSDRLLLRCRPGTRYAEHVAGSHPGDVYRRWIDEFVGLVRELIEQACDADRADLLAHYRTGIRYEFALVESAWRLETWPAGPAQRPLHPAG